MLLQINATKYPKSNLQYSLVWTTFIPHIGTMKADRVSSDINLTTSYSAMAYSNEKAKPEYNLLRKKQTEGKQLSNDLATTFEHLYGCVSPNISWHKHHGMKQHVQCPQEFRALKCSKLLQLLDKRASKPPQQSSAACSDNCDDPRSRSDRKV